MNLIVQAIGFGIVFAALIATGAMGFSLQFGLTNVLNISYGSIMTVGGLVAYLCDRNGLSVWWAIFAGGAAGAIFTAFLGKTVFRLFARRGAQLFEMVMVTLGLSLIIAYTVSALSRNAIYSLTFSQGRPLNLGGMSLTVAQIILVCVSLVFFLTLEGVLRLTRLGKALRAMSADPHLARSCGISTGRIVNVTWLISGFLCGAAGVEFVINSLSVSAFTGDSFLPSVIAAAILGGIGSPRGSVLAALLLGVATELVAAEGGSGYSSVAALGILAAVLLVKPGRLTSGDIAAKAEIIV